MTAQSSDKMLFLKGVTAKESHAVVGFNYNSQYRKYIRNPNFHYPEDTRYYVYDEPRPTWFAITACGYSLEVSNNPKRFNKPSCGNCYSYVEALKTINHTVDQYLERQA